MTTTAPRPGQAGYIADPRTAQQIAAMGGPFAADIAAGRRAPVTSYKPYYQGRDANDILSLINDSEYGPGYDAANNVEDVTSMAGMPRAAPQPNANDAQQAFMAQRGIQGGLDEKAMKATERLLGNAGFHFGQGGGDWAKAWTQARQPLKSNFMKMYGGIDTDLFNSASGPYGQMQAAAAYTAPARNDRQAREYEADTSRAIANQKYDTIGQLFSRLSDRLAGPNVANVESDYGAFAKVMPTIMAKYMPKR